MIPLLLLFFLISKKIKNNDIINIFSDVNLNTGDNKKFLLQVFLLILVLTDDKTIDYFRGYIIESLTSGDYSSYILSVCLHLFILVAGLLPILYFIIEITTKSVSDIKNNRPSFSLVFVTSCVLSEVFNYSIQSGIRGTGALLDYYIFPGALLYQFFILLLFCLFVYLVINRYLLSTILLVILGSIITIINSIKEVMRSEPLLITDFSWIKDVGLIVGFVDFTLVFSIISVLIVTFGVFFVLRKRVLSGPIFPRTKERALVLMVLMTIVICIYNVFKTDDNGNIIEGVPIISSLNNDGKITWLGFSTNARYKSLMYVWTKQLTTTIMNEPDGYNENRVNEIMDKYRQVADEINATRENNISDQTVILILSESFSDPGRLNGVTSNMEIVPFYDHLKEFTTTGLMKSDGYGGSTANMEYQSLTGLPLYNFSDSVSVLYSEVAPKMSLIPSISNSYDSDNRFVIHSSGASGYNRKQVYELMGYSSLIFTSDTDKRLTNIAYEGANISDRTVYDNILENINADQSQFFSVITMQNHVPWVANMPSDLIVEGINLTDQANYDLTNYSRLLNNVDASTQNFLDSLSELDKPVTVVFYGDHLPGLYPDSFFYDNPENKYLTDYFIWSNHETEKLDYPMVNSSDFPALLLQHTHSKVSPYYALLTDVLNNSSVDKTDLSDEGKEIANDLEIIQYDITLGKDYSGKSGDFFSFQ